MINWLFKIFRKNKDLTELQEIWDNLDPALKDCAMEEFEFGKYSNFLKLNEIGMCQLIQHLDKHGFKIRKKL